MAPEAQVLTAPHVVAFANGAASTVRWGLGDCDNGWGYSKDDNCARVTAGLDDPAHTRAGHLNFSVPGGGPAEVPPPPS